MPDPNTEHGLRVQLATALRERDLARAEVQAWKDGVCQDCVESQAAIAAARRECDLLRRDPQRALAAELLAEFEKAYAETESQMTDSDRVVARRFIGVVAALAAPAAGEETYRCPHGRGSNESCRFCSVTGEPE